jgi:xylulokinase
MTALVPDAARRHGPVALGIDLGTSSSKAVVVDAEGHVLAQAAADYPVRSRHQGWAETDPDDWWAAVTRSVREVVGKVGVEPAAIGLAGQMHGLVLADEYVVPIRPALLWADNRAVDMMSFYRALGPSQLARLANPLTPGMAGPLLAWVAAHEPDNYERARWALQPKDWLRARLTGQVAAEPSDASATLLYDIPGDRWDLELMSSLGLAPRLLAPLLDDSAALAGTLTPGAAADLGLTAGIPVAAGAGDTAAAALGSGVVDHDDVQLTVGTGAQVIRPVTSPLSRARSGVHLYRSAWSGSWYHMGASTNAGITLNWVRAAMNASWEELYASVDEPIRPSDPVFVPHLTGERTPYLNPHLRGSWTGLSLTHDRNTMLRSVLEGVAFAIAEAFATLVGSEVPQRLLLAGGGTAAQGWRQLLSTAIGIALYAVDTPAASGRGAALLGARVAQLVSADDITGRLAPTSELVAEPRADLRAMTEDRRGRFHQLVLRLSVASDVDNALPQPSAPPHSGGTAHDRA